MKSMFAAPVALSALVALGAVACESAPPASPTPEASAPQSQPGAPEGATATGAAAPDTTTEDTTSPGLMKATFAGGCFWCMEPPFDALDGVTATISGYAGGTEVNPTYEQVSAGRTSHTEVVQVTYDPKKVTYDKLLYVFWRNIEPTQVNGQFVDRGTQYRTAIYTHNDEQLKLAKASKQDLAQSGKFDKPIAVEIKPLNAFYPAEDYHQNFYKKSPVRYYGYRKGSGRDQFIIKTWGKKTYE